MRTLHKRRPPDHEQFHSYEEFAAAMPLHWRATDREPTSEDADALERILADATARLARRTMHERSSAGSCYDEL